MNDTFDANELYPCEGICRVDPESGDCLGCGRPVDTPSTSNPSPLAKNTKEEPSPNDPA